MAIDTLNSDHVMEPVAALGVFHLTGVISRVLCLKTRENELSSLEDLNISWGVGVNLFRIPFKPFPCWITNGVTWDGCWSSPWFNHVTTKRSYSCRNSICRNLSGYFRTLSLTNSSTSGNPKLVLDMLLKTCCLKKCVCRRQISFAMI